MMEQTQSEIGTKISLEWFPFSIVSFVETINVHGGSLNCKAQLARKDPVPTWYR